VSPHDLIVKLNGYPPWAQLDARDRSRAFEAISSLSDIFRCAGTEGRRSITEGLSESAKYLMSFYSLDRAAEGRRTGSKDVITAGLVPVVMAGGRSDTRTGGLLLSLLLNSAERSGLDGHALFADAAQLATSEASRAQIRGFPSLPPELRGIARFGFRERQTPAGVVYEEPGQWMVRPRWWDKLLGLRRAER